MMVYINGDDQKAVSVFYISRENLSPLFGKYEPPGTIYVREDLPNPVRDFVLEHEWNHHRGHGEIYASLYASIKYPLGFVVTVIMSLSWCRLRFYLNRIRARKQRQSD